MSPKTLNESLLLAVEGKETSLTFPQEASEVPLFNKDIPIVPAAIVKPETAQQVAAIVKCAVERGLKVQAKSGGHSYANHGFGGLNGSIVVDTTKLNHLSMDTETYTATVGGGCLLGDLAQFLYKYGRAMPHGTWPGVGLGGHATTGGIGPASRMWGLTLDHVIGVEVVLADSSIVDASEDKNSDLFFAIKGAAASFGIVTQFRLRTHVAPGECVRFQHTMESFDVATRSEWFKMWQRLMADPLLSRFLSVGLEVFPQKMVIGGNYFRSKKDFDDLDLLAALPSGGTYQETVAATWIDMVDGWAEGIRTESQMISFSS
ncbi:unnamed protein product [Zymoseptoria tritici ST99CH_3D7]|uniref:FAD-binding PCMH-type domain-containing protein n=1 Tax=Zymoseptoria tritici (strain ST99CH_3D7) TaxID=1276538 RepID=A0A1X7RPL0_ZYMT9|nr:unnamed protein product [Zymoseptoria tritici ST99CH_3D7]